MYHRIYNSLRDQKPSVEKPWFLYSTLRTLIEDCQVNKTKLKQHIRSQFGKTEYPIDREPHINYSTPCPCCFRKYGRIWQLKGLGNKSVNKNKGMKRNRIRDLKYYNDF